MDELMQQYVTGKVTSHKTVSKVQSGVDTTKLTPSSRYIKLLNKVKDREVKRSLIASIFINTPGIFVLDLISDLVSSGMLRSYGIDAKETINTFTGCDINMFNEFRAKEREMMLNGYLKPINLDEVEIERKPESNVVFQQRAYHRRTIFITEVAEILDNYNHALIEFDNEQRYYEEAILPEDDLYSIVEKEPDFSNVLENDNFGFCIPEKKTQEIAEIVQTLPNREKLIKVKVGSVIKYVVAGEDVDVARLPTIYKLVREELKMGRNITTDRLTRILKLADVLDMEFTRKEAGQLMDLPDHIINSDYRILKEIRALNGDI